MIVFVLKYDRHQVFKFQDFFSNRFFNEVIEPDFRFDAFVAVHESINVPVNGKAAFPPEDILFLPNGK